jgi:hypothetical protein
MLKFILFLVLLAINPILALAVLVLGLIIRK